MGSLKGHQPVTVLKVDKLRVAIHLVLRPRTFLNTEECHNQPALNPPDQCHPNRANSLLNRVATVDRLFNRRLSTINLRWLTEDLPVLVVMVVVNNNLQLPNGTLPHHKALATALVDTKVKQTILMRTGHDFPTF